MHTLCAYCSFTFSRRFAGSGPRFARVLQDRDPGPSEIRVFGRICPPRARSSCESKGPSEPFGQLTEAVGSSGTRNPRPALHSVPQKLVDRVWGWSGGEQVASAALRLPARPLPTPVKQLRHEDNAGHPPPVKASRLGSKTQSWPKIGF